MSNHFKFYSFTCNGCFYALVVVLILFSCNNHKSKDINSQDASIDQKIDLITTDRSFAIMSKQHGMRDAFIEYLDSNGVILRPNQLPIEGGDAIDYLIQQNDNNFILTWEPKRGEVAESGDLGYTYGIYAMSAKVGDSTTYGTYTSVWKKQSDGKWKLLLHSWNEGLQKNNQ